MYTRKQLMCTNKPVRSHIHMPLHYISTLRLNPIITVAADTFLTESVIYMYYKLSNYTLLHEHIGL